MFISIDTKIKIVIIIMIGEEKLLFLLFAIIHFLHKYFLES